MMDNRIYFYKEDYYSHGKHGCSSASRDIIYKVFNEVAPTIFKNLTTPERQIIDQILSIKETYKLKNKIITNQRELRDMSGIQEKLEKVNIQVCYFPPQGKIINLIDYLDQADEIEYQIAKELIVPINIETLELQKKILEESLAENLKDYLECSVQYIEENISESFSRWWLAQLRDKIELFFKKT